MSEHRRKPPQPQGGGRASARRGAQQPPARAAGARRDVPAASHSGPYAEQPAPGGRAEARRAAQRGAAGRGKGAGKAGRGTGRPDKRLINYPRSDRDGWKRFVPSWKFVSGTCVGFFAIIVAGAGIGIAMVNKPDPNKAAQAQNNVFLWADNTQMVATGGSMNRQIVTIGEIPLSMQNAVIAAENQSFETDKGVDPMGIVRAVWNMAKGGSTQGGSTITQQYVKNTYLDSDQTLKRKVTELFISIKLGVSEEKDTVLAGYLNTAYYGRDAYGIQAAARAYFGKDAKELNPSECAFLASMLKGPNLYNPDGGIGTAATPELNEQRARKRWAWVLDREVEVGRMTKEDRAKYKDSDFPARVESEQARGMSGQIGYLVETAKQYVMKTKNISAEQMALGGYRIRTTFQKPRVDALVKAVEDTRDNFLDEKKRPELDTFVQFGAASVDVKTGAIVALYGGPGWDKKYFSNNANTIGVPVGSTWKPYVLAAAMEYGTQNSKGQGISVDSKYMADDLTVIKNRQGKPLLDNAGRPFKQKNESPTAFGFVTLNEAMEKSINVPFAQLVFDVGHTKVREVAKSTGILEDSMDKADNASFALGTSTPSAIRMADSYATFAASGTHREPFSVSEVVKDGEPLTGFEAPADQRAMDSAVADNVTKVLENVVQNGTGTKVKKLGRPAAGKTGTTDQNKSAWFVGYTPELSTSVALFRTDPNSADKKLISMNGVGGTDSIHGGDIPAVIWTEYMREALKGLPEKKFPEPEDIGVVADSAGAPSPSPSPSPSPTPSPTPTPTTPSPTPSPTPTPSNGGKPSCKPWELYCDPNTAGGTGNGGNGNGGNAGNGNGGNGNGGNGNGGLIGGADGGTSSGTSPTPTGKPGRPGGSTAGWPPGRPEE
ncbi:penicillin-binding protein [Streptomyces subrutilus]|uniref:Penicillin-binding protein n=1 Tax=Streptomyces subrutilus TaxID=36818 RepID=A0A5P2UKH6_9ACTN|nr:transglycosylase domain-containing protein [Streptomyces subrutilus]QEU79816.1 penicillin-binding protein [Streptomyces subrutilus]GGZ68622.1 penicillin-binding protein [Streptomyces subrutilus]